MVGGEWPGSLWRALEAAEEASPVDAVEAVTRELGVMVGATEVSFLVADLSGRALVRLTHVPVEQAADERESRYERGPDADAEEERRDVQEVAEVIPFVGGPREHAVRTQTVQVLAPGHPTEAEQYADQWTVLAPMTHRGEVIGLLELRVPHDPDPESRTEIARVAHILTFVVIASRRHTDLYEWGQRSSPYSLSAEIQQRLLPGPRTCEADAFTLSAWLEPAAEIAGDTFDYSLGRQLLHLSMTDAMGHGVAAALTASLCLGGLRGARRQGASLTDQAAATNRAMSSNAVDGAPDNFVTGLIGRVELSSGALELVNAGHVPPFLVRAGVVTTIDLPADLPFGMFAETHYRSTVLRLEPGDRIVIVTDGMLERNAAGADLTVAIEDTRDLHPREVVRLLADSVLRATGHGLEDDATVMVLDWHGGGRGQRRTNHGADQTRASAAPHASLRQA